ncbi:unannotated protein [freshwater metagenome]|uniref:Unannotated protein n=1 Tax=freshwater metagenome TaxID=449393 RepID=A0A6J6N493_9ZZZZ
MPVTPPDKTYASTTSERLALARMAPVRSALVRLALLRSASLKLTVLRSASVRSASVRSLALRSLPESTTPRQCAPGPMSQPFTNVPERLPLPDTATTTTTAATTTATPPTAHEIIFRRRRSARRPDIEEAGSVMGGTITRSASLVGIGDNYQAARHRRHRRHGMQIFLPFRFLQNLNAAPEKSTSAS